MLKIISILILFSSFYTYRPKPSFRELLELQKADYKKFDSLILSYGNPLLSSKWDTSRRSRLYFYTSFSTDNNQDFIGLERKIDTINFGKQKHFDVLITTSLITYNGKYYKELLEDCKKEGYYSWPAGSQVENDSKLKYKEYRNKADVTVFSEEILSKDTLIYKVSLFTSPK